LLARNWSDFNSGRSARSDTAATADHNALP
jgi:hypothetical protein